MSTQHERWEQNRYKFWLKKERARNRKHKSSKPQGKRRSIWGQTCQFMSMLYDKPKTEDEMERKVRILDAQIHRLSTYKF